MIILVCVFFPRNILQIPVLVFLIVASVLIVAVGVEVVAVGVVRAEIFQHVEAVFVILTLQQFYLFSGKLCPPSRLVMHPF